NAAETEHDQRSEHGVARDADDHLASAGDHALDEEGWGWTSGAADIAVHLRPGVAQLLRRPEIEAHTMRFRLMHDGRAVDLEGYRVSEFTSGSDRVLGIRHGTRWRRAYPVGVEQAQGVQGR